MAAHVVSVHVQGTAVVGTKRANDLMVMVWPHSVGYTEMALCMSVIHSHSQLVRRVYQRGTLVGLVVVMIVVIGRVEVSVTVVIVAVVHVAMCCESSMWIVTEDLVTIMAVMTTMGVSSMIMNMKVSVMVMVRSVTS